MEKDNKKETGKTMKALVLQADLSLKVEDVPIPKPRDGEVLVKIIAAPINPSDLAFLKGFYSSEKPHPCIPGFEGSGIVVQNGGGMIGWTMTNKRVALAIQKGFTGTFGQYAIASSQQVMPIPSQLSYEQASMSFVNPLTAIVMLDKVKSANIKAIIHTAAASSLGRMMNRLFNSEGIPIINVVRREEQIDLLKKQGAKYVLNSSTQNFEQELAKLAKQLKATLCYDAVAGDLTAKILKALPPYSTIQIYGAMSQQPTVSGLDVSEILFKNKTVKGFWLTEELKQFGLLSKLNLMRKLGNLLKNQLKSTISKQVPLDKFEEGLDHYLKNMTAGKVLIKPWEGYEEIQPVSTKQDKKKKEKQEKKKTETNVEKSGEKPVESTLPSENVQKKIQTTTNPVIQASSSVQEPTSTVTQEEPKSQPQSAEATTEPVAESNSNTQPQQEKTENQNQPSSTQEETKQQPQSEQVQQPKNE